MGARLNISEARGDIAEVVNRVAYTKERVVVHRRGKDLVALVPMEDLKVLEEIDERQRTERRRLLAGMAAVTEADGMYDREEAEIFGQADHE